MQKLVSREQLVEECTGWREAEKKIGFTSGVFDLLHPGHVSYLAEAKKSCDVLIVGLNSDASVRSIKGDKRPIVPERARADVLAGLTSVDRIFLFDEPNNNENVTQLKPHFYFKAGDYSKDKMSSAPIVEEHGGEVKLVSFEGDYSSSRVIDTVVERYGDRASASSGPASRPERCAAVFLDRDGTINEEIEYLHEPEKLQIIPGAFEGMKRLRASGYRIVIVTNQPGIGLGYFTKEDFFRVNKELLKQASEAGVMIDKIYFSPHSKAEGSNWRKPSTGMIDRAVRELNIDLGSSFVIGDSTSDLQLAKNAGCKSILVKTGKGGGDGLYDIEPDLCVDSLLKAAEEVEQLGPPQITENAAPLPPQLSTRELEAIGDLTAKIGHDFNNLLGCVQGCIDLIENRVRKLSPDENPIERQVKIIRSALAKAVEFTKNLRSYVRSGELSTDEASLSECVHSAIEALDKGGALSCEVAVEILEDSTVQINEFSISRVLVGLLMNAVEAMQKIKEASVFVLVDTVSFETGECPEELQPGRYGRVNIVDHGVGLSSAARKDLFKPFTSSKASEVGKGLGLSLTMARELMQKHGGALLYRSQKEAGTVAQLYFPIIENSD